MWMRPVPSRMKYSLSLPLMHVWSVLLAWLERIQADEERIASYQRALTHLVRSELGGAGDSFCKHDAILLTQFSSQSCQSLDGAPAPTGHRGGGNSTAGATPWPLLPVESTPACSDVSAPSHAPRALSTRVGLADPASEFHCHRFQSRSGNELAESADLFPKRDRASQHAITHASELSETVGRRDFRDRRIRLVDGTISLWKPPRWRAEKPPLHRVIAAPPATQGRVARREARSAKS